PPVWRPPSAPAAVDTTRARTGPPATDSTRVRSAPLEADTTRRVPALRVIDLIDERKAGAASLENVLPLRWAAFLAPLPLFGPSQGSLSLPDGGGPVRLDGWIREGERATDESLIGSIALGWGAPWLAFALDDPRTNGTDLLDLDSIELPAEPGDFREPGGLLAGPVPRGPSTPAAPGDTTRSGASRTTLLYRKGSGDTQLTGARFQTGLFHRRFYASYTRNQADGLAPLDRSVSSRYALRADLGRWASHRFALEGLLYQRSIQDSTGGASEWDRRHVALRATHEGDRWSDAWRLRLGSSKETWALSPDFTLSPEAGSRERWEFPTASAEGSISYRSDPATTWITSFQAASRKIVYRVDSLPAFEPRRGEARARLGGRRALGGASGVGFDAAYDVREAQPSFWDGRVSLWSGTGGARGRIDLESAHDRPSWVDLLTPVTLHTFASPTTFVLTQLRRSGDSALRPRRFSGALGTLGLTPLRGLDLEISGSYRHVTDDFGWNVSADTSGGVNQFTSAAGERGSGWLSHGALGWEFKRGAIRARGVAWIRGGPDSLAPQAGSPPRRALDSALDLRVVLFQGDLPLRFGVESHARGPRQGLIREAGQVTWDGTLSADFGAAGVYVRVGDLFDRRPGSAIWDPTVPSGAPLPGRTFQVGVSWNLLD
ncbi:MAG TPA: hypothetical protein VEU09_06720, partial [Candidatus Binatia bacterium]|nr:hypothetical protein [Candidatus Binatia bacterium]